MAFWRKKQTEDAATRSKKPGILRRTWRKFKNIDWKNPVNRWKLVFVSFAVIVVGVGVMAGALTATNSPTFCKACHEMGPEYKTYQASAHNQIKCTQCHIEPGIVHLVTHKIGSMKEVYYHIVGVPDPIAQTVAVEDTNCKQCHSTNRLVTATGDLIVNHQGHVDEGIPCVTCHSGVAHSKIVERGLNTAKNIDKWKEDGATEHFMDKEYMAPNMGSCIDCHDKVNKGEKPWTEYAYQLPPEGAHHLEMKAAKDTKEKAADGEQSAHAEGASTEETHVEKEKLTQDRILVAIGKQKADVKISMECFTCHKEISTPKNHDIKKWNQKHGGFALKELDTCLNCHKDSKWVKHFEKEDPDVLLAAAEEAEYTPNITVVKEDSRKNSFCSACHANRPDSHATSDTWLTDHADKAGSNEQKAQCYVCHDRAKPLETKATEAIKAPTDVYCEFCHRTGFKSDKS